MVIDAVAVATGVAATTAVATAAGATTTDTAAGATSITDTDSVGAAAAADGGGHAVSWKAAVMKAQTSSSDAVTLEA
jgi:hypothetical protein